MAIKSPYWGVVVVGTSQGEFDLARCQGISR